nr:unnamed protein product [Spirometra erinaceieuropaei]
MDEGFCPIHDPFWEACPADWRRRRKTANLDNYSTSVKTNISAGLGTSIKSRGFGTYDNLFILNIFDLSDTLGNFGSYDDLGSCHNVRSREDPRSCNNLGPSDDLRS